jgi:DNA-binding NtrC family response regulator
VTLHGFDAARPAPDGARAPAAAIDDSKDLRIAVGTTVADAEKRLILATLRECGGNKNQAARILGLSLKTIYNRLKAYRPLESATAES